MWPFRKRDAGSQLPHSITNTRDGSELLLVPSGAFLSGDPPSTARLPAFYMGMLAVTNEQYCHFLNDRKPTTSDQESWISFNEPDSTSHIGSRVIANGVSYAIPEQLKNHPVTGVTWFGAVAYCEWAGLRLPTSTEWEKAARGTDGRIYPWGNEWDENKCRHSIKGSIGTCPVAEYQNGSSPYGILQMSGNVDEWCSDWFKRDRDGGGWRVIKGGSWDQDMGTMMKSLFNFSLDSDIVRYRCFNKRGIRPFGPTDACIGFRVAKSA